MSTWVQLQSGQILNVELGSVVNRRDKDGNLYVTTGSGSVKVIINDGEWDALVEQLKPVQLASVKSNGKSKKGKHGKDDTKPADTATA